MTWTSHATWPSPSRWNEPRARQPVMRRAHPVDVIREAERPVIAAAEAVGDPDAVMRRAAAGVAHHAAALLRERTGGVYGRSVLLLVGPGDNGGDALYAGALLRGRGCRVDAALVDPGRVHGRGLAALRRAGGRIRDAASVGRLSPAADLAVDGGGGLGGSGPLRAPAAGRGAGPRRRGRGAGAPGRRPGRGRGGGTGRQRAATGSRGGGGGLPDRGRGAVARGGPAQRSGRRHGHGPRSARVGHGHGDLRCAASGPSAGLPGVWPGGGRGRGEGRAARWAAVRAGPSGVGGGSGLAGPGPRGRQVHAGGGGPPCGRGSVAGPARMATTPCVYLSSSGPS